MSEAPERIWADPDHWIEGPPISDLASQGYTEYIRADHVDALLKAEREKALREAANVMLQRAKACATLVGADAEGQCEGGAEDILALIEKQ